METIKCIVLDNREITGYSSAKELLDLSGEELFVIDLDGLNHSSYNFKLYYEISKFFEITVMSFPDRTPDLVDTIISGASRVVVSSTITERRILDFLAITEDVVMNYGSMRGCRFFSEKGGRFYMSNRLVDLPFEKVYIYGSRTDRKGYVYIEGFPEFIYNETL